AIKMDNRRKVISLDLVNGKTLSPISALAGTSSLDAIQILNSMKPDAFIYLDLAHVGAGSGVNEDAVPLLEHVKTPIYLGGGMKRVENVLEARKLGFAGTLVATALQDGSISKESIKKWKLA
ncbi:hypothetical protein GF325_17895, partial [Candidatus Bathyarchaeota archaeon]|nr:hypothetical protein [Candidatus Bathyarchaeota archaeon]